MSVCLTVDPTTVYNVLCCSERGIVTSFEVEESKMGVSLPLDVSCMSCPKALLALGWYP